MAAIAADSNLASAFNRHFISFSSALSEFYQDIYGCSSIQSLELSDYLLFAGTVKQMWRINMAEMENDSVTEIKRGELIISRVFDAPRELVWKF
jgi:hypothetical protein